ncbi:MAG: hypothetical protein IKX54_04740 [Lachnospiraceae bacterium]|nr:hypothetical protein [Lachnospiraceae bacterium]
MAAQTTDDLFLSLSKIHSEEELSAFLSELRKEGHTVTLSNYLNNIMHIKGLLLRNVVSESNLEQHYAYQIINGNKQNPSRVKVLALCLACHMTLEETQHALAISQNGILYPRNSFDAIIIYNITHGNWSVYEINEQLLHEGLAIIE